ncbi:MAG: hypothetical protein MUF34_35750 [Polyangiaceae bacterium]|nr:hypothetical protein [Polyangiaceae bacterium]
MVLSLAAAAPGCGDDDGPAAEPHLRGEWQSVWFDTVRGRAESEPLSVKVVNDGAAPSQTLGADIVGDTNAFRIVDDGCGGRALPPLGSCAIALAFGAGQVGPFEGALRVWSIATPGQPGTALELPLWGKMAPAELSATVDAATKDVVAGSVETFYVLVKNEGGLPSGPIAVTAGQGLFTIAGDCVGRRLEGGEVCSVNASYAPPFDAAGGPVSSLIAVEAEPGGASSVNLVANVGEVGGLEVSDLDFGAVPTGLPATRTLTVRNGSARPTTVTSVFFNDATDAYSLSVGRDTCTGVAFAPGATCEIDALLAATFLTSPFKATLRVNGDGALASAARVFGTRYRAHYQITATTAGNGGGSLILDGTDSGTSVAFVGPNGSTATLQAAPSSLSTFAGWSGACTGTGDCVLTPADNADLEVTATFNFTP